METTLKVEGMMCPKCEARVKKALEAVAGVESAEPQPGISIKVTTWSDGSRTSEKVVR